MAKRIRVGWEGHDDPVAQGSWAMVNGRLLPELAAVPWLDLHFATPQLTRAAPPRAGRFDVWVTHYYPGLDGGRPAWNPPPPGARRWVVYLNWEHGPFPPAWEASLRAGRCREVWVPSAHTRRLVLATTALDPARVVVLPYGVDPDVYRPDAPASYRDDDAFRVLYVGGSLWRKGADLAVEAYCRAFTADEPTRLVLKLQGVETFYRDAPPLRAPAGRTDFRVIQSDALTDQDMAGLYVSCDVVCQPYRAEGFCLPLLEAMACYRPVVYPASGPGPEFVPQEAGIAVPVKGGEPDVDAVARALRFLWLHAGHRRAMGKAGRRQGLILDWHSRASIIADRIDRIAGARDAGDAFTPPREAVPAG